MKIVHVQHPYIPDLGYQENHLPAEQQALGHDVVILTSTWIPIDRGADNQESFEPGTYEYNGVTTYRQRPYFKVQATGEVLNRGLYRKLTNLNPDVIHCHGVLTPNTVPSALYSFRTGTALVIDDHLDEDNFSVDTPFKRVLFGTYRSTAFAFVRRQTDYFAPIQAYSRTILQDVFDVPDDRMELLPLGVDTDTFYPDGTLGESVRADLNISSKEPLLITAGHFEPEKRIEQLVRALAEIETSASLLLVGRGPDQYMSELFKLSEEKDVAERVHFYGYATHEELRGLYNAADVGVWAGIGISINQAMATGLPVIAPDVEAKEHLLGEIRSMTFERERSDELVDKIDRYLNDANLRSTHGSNAAAFIADELSWEAIAERSLELYERALANRR
jgi:glycosyltransferase involved in cell wall biosynthesis